MLEKKAIIRLTISTREVFILANSDFEQEDLSSNHPLKTTIQGVDMQASDWVEQAAAQTQATCGDNYVQLDRGILTADQLTNLLNSLPGKLTFVDPNNQFLYYNNSPENQKNQKLAVQVGDSIENTHPHQISSYVKQVMHALKTGQSDLVKIPLPTNNQERYVVYFYKAVHDQAGNYAGVNEWSVDIMPLINWYLQQTGQKLGPSNSAPAAPKSDMDALTGASQSAAKSQTIDPDDLPDSITGASTHLDK